MARETAHQRKLRELAEREALEAAKAISYPHALMSTLARASQPKWDFTIKIVQHTVDSFAYKVTWRDRWADDQSVILTANSSWDNWDKLETIENEMDAIEAARAEELRRLELRQNALNKLTVEEKQVLGL